MQIQLSEVALFCLDVRPATDAAETLLFIHGFPLDHSMWEWQVHEISKSYRCLVPDLRGFGGSAIDGVASESGDSSGSADSLDIEQTSMATFADDLAELLDELSITKPITVCGLSMGGYIAFELWQRHPDKIGRLILCDTRAESDPVEVARGRQMMANQVSENGMTGVADGMIPKLVSNQTLTNNPNVVGRVRQMIDGAEPLAVAAAHRGMATRESFQNKLAEIDVPTLVLCGTHDSITDLETMKALASQIPGSEFAEVPSAGHLAPLEQPAIVNEVILNWLQSKS